MESQELNEILQFWPSNNPGPSSVNMSDTSSSSSSQGRQGPLPTKRTLSEPSSARQLGPTPVKRQYQAPSTQNPDEVQLQELDRLEKKEASLINQLLHQLQMLHKRCNEERHQIVEEQRRLAERLEQIDANEKAEEQAIREKNERKLERVRLELFQLRQKMSLEGSTSSNSGLSSSMANSMASTSGGQLDLSNVSDIRRRLGTLDRQRQALLEQLYAAIGSINQEGSQLVDVQLHNCALGREVAGSSTVTERGLPTSQQSEIAESSEQAQEDSEITSSSDVVIPQNLEIVTENSSGNQSSSSNHTGEPTEELEAEPSPQEEESTHADSKKNTLVKDEEKSEEEMKKKEETEKDLHLALLKLKNIGALVEEELQCSICNELLVAAVTINCAHSFCKHCLGEWKKQRAECPMCRMPITAEHRSVTLDSLISTMVGQLSLELQQRHKEVVEERAALEAAAAVAAASASTSTSPSSTSSSSRQDNNGGGNHGGAGRGRHHNHNYNNNHWQPHGQPMPLPHHHHHHHHHHNNFVAHYPPHAHNHAPHAHNNTHAHGHAPHAHAHPPHAHVHPPLSQPPYHLPSLAPPTPRHSTPPPVRAPLALATPVLQSLQGMAGGAQGHAQTSQGPGGSQGGVGLQGLQNLQGGAGPSQSVGPGPGPQGSQGAQGQPHDGRARRRHGRGMGMALSSGSSSASSSEEPSDSTSSYSSTGGFSSTSDRNWYESDFGDYEEEDNEGEPPIVPGIPGRYYGGYGVCFYCNQRGHWSNGCPVRFGF